MWVGGKTNYATGGSVAPNRAQAYQAARKAESPQKGLSYPELLVDNILGLDNDYLSYGENFGQAFNLDEIGTLKNVAVGAYEGAKKAVTQPITTAEELLSGIYDSVSNLATEDLDARLTRMYGVGYQDATGEQVNKAREAVIGDALTAAELVPLGMVAKKGADVAGKAVDTAQIAQSKRFFDRNNPSVKLSGVANSQFYYPSPGESMMQRANATPEEQQYLDSLQMAEDMLASGKDASSTLYATRMLPVPLKTPLGEDFGTRLMAAMSPDEMVAIRPERASNYGISIVDEEMAPSHLGYFSGTIGKNAKIGLNKSLGPEQRTGVLRHEMVHADLDFSKLDPRRAELGANAKGMAKNKAAILNILDAKIENTSDKGLAGYYKDLRKNLRKTTAVELYQLNPGEMLARLGQGSTKMAKRLSPLETLNPYIRRRGKPLAKRGIEALQTAFRSETNPVISKILQARPDLAEKIARDYYTLVPTDISKARVTDPLYRPRNPAPTKSKSPKSSARDSSR